MTDNPLLQLSSLPDFAMIQPQHIAPAIRQLLAETDAERQRLEADLEPTWAGLMEPLEQLENRLSLAWGAVGHLMGVKNSEALRQAHQEVQGEVVQFWMRLGQSQAIYQGLKSLQASGEWTQLDAAQQRIVDISIKDADLSGVGLQGDARTRFNAIQQELAELSTSFSNHLLDATKAFHLDLHQPEDIEGLPPSLLQIAAQAAREAGHDQATPEQGPWRITLDFPSVGPFLEHSRRRDLRERVYRALITRASEGELDNTPLIERILELRREQATILGYANYAELSLASKMAPDVSTVEVLLEQLRQASFDAAHRDLAELREFARSQGAAEAEALQHWDIAFWSERLREHRYAISDEELRPYFPLPQVLGGLFALVQRLFGVTIRPADGSVPVWHPDVRFFRIYNANDEEMAAFYLDAYSRPAEKRGGAWMDGCVGRSRLLATPGTPMRLPVAYLICNQTPPVAGKPSLMSFTEVKTLFHEFGHGLHHMLTQVDYGMAAGIRNVEWDAVELPSQFMENWCYHRDTLMGMSGHVDTGEPLPEALYQKLLAARNYRSGSAMLRQLYFGFMDMELHARFDPSGDETVFDVQRRMAAKTTPLMPLPEDRFLCSFGHIFAGGYAAGYYSYKWAEVLSADAFAAFEESGLDDERALVTTGQRYRDTVLALGGSQHPMEVFKAFRGREPSTEALLRHAGLAA
jgi:oligopeptidase A